MQNNIRIEDLQMHDTLQEFLFDCRIRKLSERTISSYKNCVLKLMRYLYNEFKFDSITDVNEKILTKAIQDYIIFLTSQKLKETYINSIIKNIRAFFKYCENEGYVKESPMKKIKFQKEQITLIKTFTNTEVKKMIDYFSRNTFLGIRNHLIMIILFDTGVRNSELCSIKCNDIHKTYITITGKGNKIRNVPLTPILNKFLIKYNKVRKNYIKDKFNYDTEYLLLSQKGKKLTPETIERIVLECGTECHVREEIRISPHTCRHYYAQTQLKNGLDVYSLSRLLGHGDINITKRYLQSITDESIIEMGLNSSPLSNL